MRASTPAELNRRNQTTRAFQPLQGVQCLQSRDPGLQSPFSRRAPKSRLSRICLASILIFLGPLEVPILVLNVSRIHHATKSDCAGAVNTRSHQQVLAVLRQLIGLRKVPARTLRLIVTTAAQNRRPRMFVHILVGPLPDVADQIHHAKRACALRMR